MNRSFNKIRHIQEANLKLEKRVLTEKKQRMFEQSSGTTQTEPTYSFQKVNDNQFDVYEGEKLLKSVTSASEATKYINNLKQGIGSPQDIPSFQKNDKETFDVIIGGNIKGTYPTAKDAQEAIKTFLGK